MEQEFNFQCATCGQRHDDLPDTPHEEHMQKEPTKPVDLQFRSEHLGDEAAIEEVNCRAFACMDEPHVVHLMRQYHPGYDPRYSVLAWDGEAAVGHILGTPLNMRLMGKNVRAVGIGPVAVMPGYQKRGIGGQLLSHIHDLARREGFALTFLYGHPTYYPRYGYQACFGGAHVTIDRELLPKPTMTFRRLPVRQADIPWLVERHAAELADVDFGWPWGTCLSEWTIPAMNCLMWWSMDGRRAAYTMTRQGHDTCKLLLADDPALAREVLATIRPATLDHHPAGWLARQVLDPAWGTAQAEAWSAAMAYELQPGVLQPYLVARTSGERLPGMTMFPLPFLAC